MYKLHIFTRTKNYTQCNYTHEEVHAAVSSTDLIDCAGARLAVPPPAPPRGGARAALPAEPLSSRGRCFRVSKGFRGGNYGGKRNNVLNNE